MSVYRHGTYYTTVNTDCAEACSHALNQSFFLTGHYELVSTAQGKIGSIALSQMTFDTNTELPTQREIPDAQYCVMTNSPEHQHFYANRVVDVNELVDSQKKPVYAQYNTNANQNPTHEGEQPFVQSNIDIKVYDQVYLPAVLDAKWSNQPIYHNKLSTITNPASEDLYTSLIATALADGTVRLFTHDKTTNTLKPQSAVQISDSALCLYISWSNKQRYTHNTALLQDLLTNEECKQQGFRTLEEYVEFWEHFDAKQITVQPTNENGGEVGIHTAVDGLQITPHQCIAKDASSGNLAKPQLDDDINVDDYYCCDENDFYIKGKTAVDNFLACSLTDGSVAICDVYPIANTNATANADVQMIDDSIQYGLRLTHHWQAHQAECWVAAIDPFQPNTIYTGADDHLFKMWDLRMIDCVNYRAMELDIAPFLPSQGATAEKQQLDSDVVKNYLDTKRESTTCPCCQKTGLSLGLPQYTTNHGLSISLIGCTVHQDNQTCVNAGKCYCNGAAHGNAPPSHGAELIASRLNIDKLIAEQRFHPDFTPTASAYPLLVNNAHEGGIVDIQPHPYNPHLLMTGSYDDHIALYDKRKLKTPIIRQNTGGGAWRIKWHPNPNLSHNFLLVNMYNGAQLGHIDGLNLNLKQLTDKTEQNDISNDKYPTWFTKQSKQDENTNTTTTSHLNLYSALRSVGKDILNDNSMDIFTTPSQQQKTTTNTTSMQSVMDQLYTYNDDLSTADIVLDTQYNQHGPKSIVYGGDWMYLNNISQIAKYKTNPTDNTTQPIDNIAITGSFYNKRTDVIHFE